MRGLRAPRNRKLAHPFLVALFLPSEIARPALNKCMYLEGTAIPFPPDIGLPSFTRIVIPPAYNTLVGEAETRGQ